MTWVFYPRSFPQGKSSCNRQNGLDEHLLWNCRISLSPMDVRRRSGPDANTALTQWRFGPGCPVSLAILHIYLVGAPFSTSSCGRRVVSHLCLFEE